MQEMKTSASVRLPDDVVNYLQAMDYEIGGLKVLHTHALSAGIPMRKTKKIRRRFQKKFQEYQLAKQEVFRVYGKDYADCKLWWVDFQKGVMYFAQ